MPARTANADALLARRIRELAQPTRLPDGRELSVLPFFDAKDLARSLGRSRKPLSPDGRRRPPGRAVARVERAALAAGVMPERYLRNFDCYSLDEQLRLLSSRAAMLGLGGLGALAALISMRYIRSAIKKLIKNSISSRDQG